MSGNIALGSNKITSSFTAASNTDIPNRLYVDTADNLKLNLTGGVMSGDLNLPTLTTSNNYLNISGLWIGTNDTASVYIGYNVAGGPSNYANITGVSNFLMGQNAGFQLTTGSRNTGIGDGNCYSLVTGSENTTMGDFSGISNTGSRNTLIGAQTNNSTGTDNTCIGYGSNTSTYSNSTCLGNGVVANASNQVFIGNSSVVSISANSNCNLGTASVPFKNIYYTGSLINSNTLNNQIGLSATLFYNNLTLSTSNTSFIPANALATVGGTPVQITQTTGSTYGKLFKTSLPTTSVAAYQDSGLIGTGTFLLNSQSLYVGMGFSLKFTFGIGDTNGAVNSQAGMFVGLVSTTSIVWAAGLLPNTLPSCVGIGYNPTDSNVSFYDRGTAGGTKTSMTNFLTSTPDNGWYHLTLINQFNSTDITIIYTNSITNVSESKTIQTGGGTSQLSNTIRLYPCIQRMMGAVSVTGSAITQFGTMVFTM
jgi:hypothetical protein